MVWAMHEDIFVGFRQIVRFSCHEYRRVVACRADVLRSHEGISENERMLMSTQQNLLVPLDQITLVVDTVRLVSDGTRIGADSQAAQFFNGAGLRRSVFLTDKPGVQYSAQENDTLLLFLNNHRRGAIREFSFFKDNQHPVNLIDDGDVIFSPDTLDSDGALVFECRSRKYHMKWFFHCLTVEKSRARLSQTETPTRSEPARSPPIRGLPTRMRISSDPPSRVEPPPGMALRPELESPSSAAIASAPPVVVPLNASSTSSDEATQSLQREKTTTAAGSNGKPAAQPESSTVKENPKTLVEYLVLTFCTKLEVDPDFFATGKRGPGDICSQVKEAVVFVARTKGMDWKEIAAEKGMPSKANAYAVYARAEKRYGRGKNDFGRMVDKVASSIPENLLPPEQHVTGSAATPDGQDLKSKSKKPRASKSDGSGPRGPYKKRTQTPANPTTIASVPVNQLVEAFVFIVARQGDHTDEQIAEKFNVSVAEVHQIFGRLSFQVRDPRSETAKLVVSTEQLLKVSA